MRILLNAAWLVLIVPGFLCGQTVAQTDSSPSTSDVGAEVKALREALLQTQQQVAAQQQEIETLKAQSKPEQPGVVNASFTPVTAPPSSSVIERPRRAGNPPPRSHRHNSPAGRQLRARPSKSATPCSRPADSSISKIFTGPRILRATSPPISPAYLSATRLWEASVNSAPRRSSPA